MRSGGFPPGSWSDSFETSGDPAAWKPSSIGAFRNSLSSYTAGKCHGAGYSAEGQITQLFSLKILEHSPVVGSSNK